MRARRLRGLSYGWNLAVLRVEYAILSIEYALCRVELAMLRVEGAILRVEYAKVKVERAILRIEYAILRVECAIVSIEPFLTYPAHPTGVGRCVRDQPGVRARRIRGRDLQAPHQGAPARP